MSLISILNTTCTVVKFGWPFVILGWLVACKIRWKNWPLEAVIIEKRGDNLIKTSDRLGKYVDNFSGMTGYKLMKSGDTIPIIDFDWILHNASKPTNFLEKLVKILRPDMGTVFLFRYGSKQYKPLNPSHIPEAEGEMEYETIKGDDGKDIVVQRYQQYDPRGTLKVLNFEVVDWDNMNFMVQEMRTSFERRQKRSAWIKEIAIPLAMLSATALVCIIMIKFGFDYAKTIPSTIQPSTTATAPDLPLVGNVIPGS